MTYQDSGEVGRVCADSVNLSQTDQILEKLGESTCQMLEYQELVGIEVVQDKEEDLDVKNKYIDIASSVSAGKNMINSPCLQRLVSFLYFKWDL